MTFERERPIHTSEIKTGVSEKSLFLERYVPHAIKDEIVALAEAGYDVTVGDTEDRAYEAIEKIQGIHEFLDQQGIAFERASKGLALGSASLAHALEFSPIPQLSTVRRRIKAQREALRGSLLYDSVTIHGQPWHHQNGKALALGTIVDAHDLRVVGHDTGYDTMSGRLGSEVDRDFVFPTEGVSANLAGKRLEDAVYESKTAFRGKRSVQAAERAAEQELVKLEQFIHAPVHAGFKDIVSYCSDSLGIRSRKEEVRQEINRHVDASAKESFLMMSVGCGTAQPMLEVMHDLQEKGRSSKMVLIDQDPIALAAAVQLATQMGLREDIEAHCSQLFVGNGRSTRVMDLQDVLQGREVDICEDSGLREYFPDAMYEDLTSQAWSALADDGLMTTGNMNANRPQAGFLHGLMGWPIKVQMRHMRDIVRLHEKAGVPKGASRLRVTQDGVYTLCFSSKANIR